ncbi:MAG: polyprenyl synthetase family protein [Bacteroidota bacterium]
MKYDKFFQELSANEKLVNDYLFNDVKTIQRVKPSILEDCTLSYLKGGGKKLRPAILMLCCQAVGGEKRTALPAAAAVELFHTWTLVHDDIIDNDTMRRGVDTVHVTAGKYAREKYNLPVEVAEKYGKDAAILTGDIQHGWCISILSRNLIKEGVKPEVALHLISQLQVEMLRTLVEGETLDVEFGLFYDIDDLTEGQILDMLWKKTGVLYEFCGMAGALIGQNNMEYTAEVNALKEFCSLCGTAFQVRDDILGLIGKQNKLGKPVGSDIREGKKTLLVKEALSNASEEENKTIRATLGNSKATPSEIENTTQLIVKLGGVDKAHTVAKGYVDKALPLLDILPASNEKDLLIEWANYMIDRSY